ncbi:hypothetical protein [Halomicrobium salinisoli]|uniref:hypothetical protein n=1 Tax=Halomicrobium salinisoli TaxID=2878391 RepID=UPI001CF08AEE|nr:hypothetical protein [Halomicrobium salinisoli]
MPTYERDGADEPAVIDRWDGGVGWIAHPSETGRRASHAVTAPGGGLWLFDPIDAPGVDDLIADVGEVAGVAVLSGYHARDADAFADRYGVPVHVPRWLERIPPRLDARVELVEDRLAGFELRELRPMGLWREAVAYRDGDGTLYVPDFLTAVPSFTVGRERVAMPTFARLSAPREPFADASPDRILFGHGSGVFEDATGALRSGFDGARRRFPRALVEAFPAELRAWIGALG